MPPCAVLPGDSLAVYARSHPVHPLHKRCADDFFDGVAGVGDDLQVAVEPERLQVLVHALGRADQPGV